MPVRQVYDLFCTTSSTPILNPAETRTADKYSSLDNAINDARSKSSDLFSIASLVRGQNPYKRRKMTELKPIVFVRFNTRKGKPKPVTIRALLDSGGSGTLVTSKFAKKLRNPKKADKTVWSTPAGDMKTTLKCKAQFSIPELHDNRLIEWDVHVTETLAPYDMIIGRDVLSDLGIDLLFSNNTIEWDDSQIPFKDADATLNESYHVNDSNLLVQATEDMFANNILDNDYEEADLEAVVASQTQLSDEQKVKLKTLLEKYKPLFNGTLGSWNEKPYDIELKLDVKPYHARAYPIPRVHTATLKVEIDRLCRIGVLRKVNRSEWAAPTFIIPKKDGKVRFVSNFRELNKWIK